MALAFIILGAAVGWRYLAKTSIEDDSWNYFFYNVNRCSEACLYSYFVPDDVLNQAWLSVALALPAYYRFIIASPHAQAD